MTFLTWKNKAHAEASLTAINKEYGCPYVASNGYQMDQWDFLTESAQKGVWGFEEPEEKLGKTIEKLKTKLVGSCIELSKKPDNWTDNKMI